MTVSYANHPKRLQPAATRFYGLAIKDMATKYTEFMNTIVSDKAFEEIMSEAGIGLAVIKPQGEKFAVDDTTQGFLQTLSPMLYGRQVLMTLEMEEDDQYAPKVAQAIGSNLAKAIHSAEEVLAHSVLNEGHSAVAGVSSMFYSNPDGVALFSTAHPYEKGNGTFANTPSVTMDLSELCIETLVTMCMTFKDGSGVHLQDVKPVALIVPPQLRYKALRILNSTQRVDTANNDINPVREDNLKLIISPYLTSAKNIFLTTSENDDKGLIFVKRKNPTIRIAMDEDTLNSKNSIHSRMGVGYSKVRAVLSARGA